MHHTPISAILMGQRCGDPGTEQMKMVCYSCVRVLAVYK